MKDEGQKELLFKHFSAQGHYVQVEVPVYHSGGLREQDKLITDIDVLAFRPGNDLRWELVLGDCKTLKGQSPANRAIWLRGLMDHVGASTGVLILQRRSGQDIEPDHKLFASSLGITLLDEQEFDKFDRALNYPAGTSSYWQSTADIFDLRKLGTRFHRLQPFIEYLTAYAWNNLDYTELLRRVIGEGKSVAGEIDPGKPEHLALILEASAVFAIGAASCGGTIFHQYLQPESERQLDEALKSIIWGGRSRYEFVAKLRGELLTARGVQDDKAGGPLALPRWEEFVQLIRNLLEHPRLGFRVPQVLRSAAIDVLRSRPLLRESRDVDLPLLKLAMLTCRYYGRACAFPGDTVTKLSQLFAQLQSEIVHNERPAIVDAATTEGPPPF